MSDTFLKLAYQVRRRLPSPNVVTRIPTLRNIPSITPIAFQNRAKPNPKMPTTPSLRLAESPVIKDVRRMFKDKQEVEAARTDQSTQKVKELTKAVTTSTQSRLQAARDAVKREREELQAQKTEMEAAQQTTPEAKPDPAVEGFSNNLASMIKRLPKLKFANSIYDNAFDSNLWDSNIKGVPDDPDLDPVRSMLYSPFGRNVATSFIGTNTLSPDFQKQFQLTGSLGRNYVTDVSSAPAANPNVNVAQLLAQLGLGQPLY